MIVYWQCLALRLAFNSHLQQSFSHVSRVVLVWYLVAVLSRLQQALGLLQQFQIQPMGTGRPSVAQFQQSQRHKSGHGSLLRPWRTTFNWSQRNSGKPSGVSGGRSSTAAMHTIYGANGRLLTSNDTIVGRWKEYKDLLNFTNTYSEEETELD